MKRLLKYLLPIAVLLLLLPISAFSAISSRVPAKDFSRVRIGLHLDPLIAFFISDTQKVKNLGAKGGLSTGVDCEVFFAPRYSVVLGVAYNYYGSAYKYAEGNHQLKTLYSGNLEVKPNQPVSVAVQSLSLPVGLKMRAVQIGYWGLFAQVDMKLNFRLREKGTFSAQGIDGERLNGMYNLFSMSAGGMLGGEYHVGGSTMLVGGLGMSFSLWNVYNAGVGSLTQALIYLRLGVIF